MPKIMVNYRPGGRRQLVSPLRRLRHGQNGTVKA